MAGKGSNVGNVYVTVVPTMRGFAREMNRQLSGVDVTQTGRKIGERMGGSMATAVSDKLVRSGSAISRFGSNIADLGGKLTQGVTLPLATAAAGVGAFALSTASAAETTEMSFTTMLGSAEAAEQMMSRLADFAARTPFELSGLQTATRQLLAYGFQAEDVIPMLTAVGDATAALGTGQTGIEAVTRALGQMQAKGKVQAEEMLQLTEQGIPAWEMLADTLGTDVAGAQDMVTRGAVDSATAIDALITGMEQRYGGLMEKQSQTLAGLASNLVDSLTQPLMELRESDAYAELKDSFSEVVDAAGPFVESLLPHMERGLSIVADVLDSAADAMEGFSDMSESAQGDLIGLVAQAALAGPALTVAGKGMQVLGGGIEGVGKVVGGASDLVGGLQTKLLDFATAPGRATTPLTKLAGAIGSIPGPVGLAAAAIGGVLLMAVGDLAAKAEEAREHEELLADATRSMSDIMGSSESAAEGLGDAIGSIEADAEGTLESLRDLNDAVQETLSAQYVDEGKLSQYVDEIDRLANKSGLTATEQYRLQEAVEGYNEVVGTQYSVIDAANGKIADQSGVVQENTDQLRANADAWRARAEAEAYQGLATKYIEQEIEAERELAVAKDTLAEKQQAYNDMVSYLMDSGYSEAEAKRAADVTTTGEELEKARQDVSDLSDAYETAGQNADAFASRAAITASDASDAVKDAAGRLSDAISDMGSDVGASLESAGVDVAGLSIALAEAGVETGDLADIGEANLTRLANSCEGDTARMVWAIQNYNNVPVIDKDGSVVLDDEELVDAQGNVYTWNGSELRDQNGVAAVEDASLMDAQGRVYTWNGSSLVPLYGSANISGNLGTSLSQARAWMNLPYNLGSKIGSATFSIAQNVTQTISSIFAGNAAGGIRTHADGGVRMHAGGAIATRAVPLDIVGEDGAEAIVPLTNRRYSQPFADIIAEGVAKRSGGVTVNQTFNTKVVRSDEDLYVAAPILYRSAMREVGRYR